MDIETNFREMRLPEVTDLLDESVDETWSYTIEDLACGIGNVIDVPVEIGERASFRSFCRKSFSVVGPKSFARNSP